MTFPADFPVPSHAVQRALRKRQRAHVYDTLDPAQTALLVVDMQQYYEGRIPGLREVALRINHMADVLRERGCSIIWILNTLRRDGVNLWPEYHDRFFNSDEARIHREGLTSGAPGHALLSELTPHPQDVVAEKSRFSPFVPDTSRVPEELLRRGITNLLITGTATNVCCESTARDAMMRNYRVVCVHDAMAAITDDDHRAGLATIYSCFGDVRGADDVLDELVVVR